MPNLSDNRARHLIFYLNSFIEIMRRDHSPLWAVLVKTVNGKTATIGLDDVFLSLAAQGGTELTVTIKIINRVENPNFYSRGQVLKDIISGKYLLDSAINEGLIYVRGDLMDLLEMYYLVLNVLLEGNINLDYLRLWLDFENNWKSQSPEINCWKLEEQLPDFHPGMYP